MSDAWTTEIVQGNLSLKINLFLIKKVGESHWAINEMERKEERG